MPEHTAPPTITVVGSSNTDLVVRVRTIPRPSETLLGGDLRQVPGGKGANQAVAARRLGAEVYFAGCVGDDAFGKTARAGLAAEGLRLDYLREVAGVPSGVALIVVAESAENSIVVAPGANARLQPEDVERAVPALRESQVVVAQLEVPLASVQRAFVLGRRSDTRTLLNPSPVQRLDDALLGLVDVLICNAGEAATLADVALRTPADTERAALCLLRRGPALVVVTEGSAGCVLASAEGVRRIPAFRVPAVDTTAAGDAFTGAFAVQLARGVTPDEAARYASAAAALSVGRAGAQPSLPTGAEVEALLARQG